MLPPLPLPGPLGAIVRPPAIATCDMDRLIALGATPFLPPLSFGHECVAEVLAVGSDVASVRPGQRVVVPFQISCGACPPCLAGQTANCEAVLPLFDVRLRPSGGHRAAPADELAVPFADGMLVRLPDGLDPWRRPASWTTSATPTATSAPICRLCSPASRTRGC